MRKLAIVTTHPIQYNAPLFKMLASQLGIEVKVFYTLGVTYEEIKDKGFGKIIAWDIPLLDGYAYEFLHNASDKPGTSYFRGIINPTIIESVEAFQPSAILVYGWSFHSHLKVLRHFKNKVPIYFRGDSTLLDEDRTVITALRRLALRWVYSHINKAFYVGTQNKRYFLRHGLKEEQLIFAPHAIDNARFGKTDQGLLERSCQLRKSLGIPEKNIVFLFTGKFEKKKNPLLLLRAFKRLSQKNVDLLFVGNGSLEEDLKRKAEGIPNIHFLPFQNQKQMPVIYRSADVLVLPSAGPGETWGLCINEAMATGLPVIASNKVGCVVDLIREGVNGFGFDSGSDRGLQHALEASVHKTKLGLKTMGETSRCLIVNWSFEHICAAVTREVLSVNSVV